jgi:hypothetical protein
MTGVQGLFPPGPSFHSVNVEGTQQYHYWRAFSNVLGYTYSRLCDYVDEFFCATVNESRDQWIEEYGLNDPCDPYGHNLCLKVAAEGGATCDYFVQMAALSGLSITCNAADIPEPIAGCFEVGCTPLGPTPTFVGRGSRLGYGQQNVCDFGEVVDHPNPDKWENGRTNGASCPVPGSNLGDGPDQYESCCMIVGYYDFHVDVLPTDSSYCQNASTTITFECPLSPRGTDTSPCPTTPDVTRQLDATGNYSDWGHAYVWEVTVDLSATPIPPTTPGSEPDPDAPSSQAGCFMVGLPLFTTDGSSAGGTELCAEFAGAIDPTFTICFLDRIKPAHTTLNVKVIQP